MMLPLTRVQKIIAYASLLFIMVCTVFGVLAMWMLLTETHV
jgi:hypothetical protein